MIYFGWDNNTYTNLYLSSRGYPAGTKFRGTIDLTLNPEASTTGWEGPFHHYGENNTTTVTILDPIEVCYGQCMFYDLKKLKTIKGIDNIIGGLINCKNMFADLPLLQQVLMADGTAPLDDSGLAVSFRLPRVNGTACVSMAGMFRNLPLTGRLDMSNISTQNVSSMAEMFKGSKISEIDMRMCDTLKVDNTTEMFANCPNLTSILATEGHWDMMSTALSDDMFTGSVNLPNYPGDLDRKGAIAISLGGHIDMLVAPQVIAKTHIKLRYDSLENWLLYDPLLMAGEAAIEHTTKRIKVGDGAHKFSELPYYTTFNVDDITIKMDSEGSIRANLDYDTIIVNSEGKIAVSHVAQGELVNYWRSLF